MWRLPVSMQRAMASRLRPSERSRQDHSCEGQSRPLRTGQGGQCHRLAAATLQLRYLQTLTEIAVEKTRHHLPLPIDLVGEFSARGSGLWTISLTNQAIGRGKMIVDVLSTRISVRVWR